MIISKEAYESFVLIKDLIHENKQVHSEREFLLIQEVYSEITKRPLNKGCDGCVQTGYRILKNWSDKFFQQTAEYYAPKSDEISPAINTPKKRKYNRKK